MPPDRRKPPGGGSGRLSENVEFGGYDIPKVPHQAPTKQAARRNSFAREMTFSEFGYRAGRALDYDGFVDRKPTPAGWWRAAP